MQRWIFFVTFAFSDNLEFIIPEEGVELILFTGKDMMEVVQRFNLYCGGGFIPPKWGLGFWQRTPTLYSDEDIRKEMEVERKTGITEEDLKDVAYDPNKNGNPTNLTSKTEKGDLEVNPQSKGPPPSESDKIS